jgi:alginate O-acetyltransferase complex protein AlgI
MPFHTLRFAFFILLVWPLFLATPHAARWMLLLVASVLFFAALGVPALLVALAVVTTVSYVAGALIAMTEAAGARRALLWTAIAANVLVLAAFKYLPAGTLGGGTTLLAAVGVSFFTFQGISYVIDVYIGAAEAERHVGYFALYMAFFPKLLQGPIERAGELIPQLRRRFTPDDETLRSAAILFLWGLFKKTVVADRAGPIVDAVYDGAGDYHGLTVVVATYAYAIQLYCDWSGYTDMALGVGQLFGIRLTQNFANPYLARSIAEFWRKWHISFSRWILDYLFKPLQFALRDWGVHGTAAALLVTFLVSGVWHGAGWTYVVWGLMHGTYMVVSIYSRGWRKRAAGRLLSGRPLTTATWQVFATMHLVLLSWVVFRARNLHDAWTLLTSIGGSADGVLDLLFLNGIYSFTVLALGTLAVAWVDWMKGPRISGLLTMPVTLRWAAYYVLAAAILVLGADGRGTFIYFQF